MKKNCKVCDVEFTPSHHKRLCCSTFCSDVNYERIQKKSYEKLVKPNLPGRKPKKTEAELKETERKYNNSPERKAFMKEYRKPEERRIKERESGKKWQKRNPHIEKNAHLKRNFGITLEDYTEMLKAQNGVCDICKKPEKKVFKKTGKVTDLCVDHCHSTGKVRGLLCWDCNTSIGKLNESIETLKNAILYLKRNQ